MKVAILTIDNREHSKDYGCPAPYFGTAPEALLQGLARVPEAQVHIVSCARERMISPQQLAPNIFFRSLYVPKMGWMKTAYQGCVRAVRKALKEIQPDIVHGQGTERDCALSAVFSGFPNVITIHGNMAHLARVLHSRVGSFFWLAGRLENFALGRTAGVFCNSEHTERLVQGRAQHTWRVPNAVREQFFIPKQASQRTPKCTLLNVGVVSPYKRQIELLDAARNLHEQGLDFRLLFVGHAHRENPYAADFLRRVNSPENQAFASYLGQKSVKELIQLYDGANALIHFPLEESFGLVIAEALARGLKIFAGRVGGIVDIVEGSADAELFDSGDLRGLQSAIAAWIRGGFPQASGNAELMRSRYHPDQIARRHLEIYSDVLSGRLES